MFLPGSRSLLVPGRLDLDTHCPGKISNCVDMISNDEMIFNCDDMKSNYNADDNQLWYHNTIISIYDALKSIFDEMKSIENSMIFW